MKGFDFRIKVGWKRLLKLVQIVNYEDSLPLLLTLNLLINFLHQFFIECYKRANFSASLIISNIIIEWWEVKLGLNSCLLTSSLLWDFDILNYSFKQFSWMNTGNKWRYCFRLQFIITRSLCFVLFFFFFVSISLFFPFPWLHVEGICLFLSKRCIKDDGDKTFITVV